MKYSRHARLLLGAVLALTLGVKAAWTRDAPPIDQALFVVRADALLRANGFATRRLTRPFGTLLFGRGNGCDVMIAYYPPYGTFAEILEVYARPVGPLRRYVWRGRITEEAPKLVPLGEFYVEQELRRAGFRPPRHPIVAIAASPGCVLERVDWSPLASLPR